MKLKYAMPTLLLSAFSTFAQIVNIPDPNFKTALTTTVCADFNDDNVLDSDVDTNDDGEIQETEALAVLYLSIAPAGSGPPLRTSGSSYDTSSPSANNVTDVTGIASFLNLKILNVSGNLLTTLDVSMLTQLTQLQCSSNDLISINYGNLASLSILVAHGNNLTTLDVSSLPALTVLICGSNEMTALNLQNATALTNVDCTNNNLTTLDISQQTALTTLRCGENQLTTLNLQNASNLSVLECHQNLLTNLDLAAVAALTSLRCDNNMLTSIDLTGVPNLVGLWCYLNSISILDVSMLSNLALLNCSSNALTSLDVSGLTALEHLYCQSNQITTLTFGGNHSLLGLNCGWNLIETLDVTQTNVMQLNCGNNPSLTQIFMKNGIDTPEIYGSFPAPPIPGFYATETPLLEFICADDNEIDAIIANLNGQMVSVTSYCTFIPGGTFNTIAGTITYGCGSANISVPNTAINVNDGTNLGITYSSDSGEYMFYPGPGNHVISLQMPNASYFTVSPATYTFNLTSTGNSESANFCLSANGVHPDLEITLLPLNAARPGFDADYKIIFSNNGTEVQSGNILLTFDDAVLDFISANPAVSNQGVNSLSWDFVNLMPFETREISFILNVNAPTETPPINNGDTLSFACSVNTTFTDETPADNVDSLVQTVVGSFDPNDKTVLEGSQISTSQIGDYLHYVVRFQNTGTAPATNVVIQDRLAANLDLSTLELISASHPFRSSLTDENNLEFFFDGINLPASIDDEPGSHGYVAFKIKPVTSLVVGDVIENTANIYFDFNFPVVTNTVSTTVTSLGLVESEKDTVSLYPNPATSNIRFSMPINSEFSVVIYNMLGQRVQSAKIDESRTLDVSGLETGTYLVEIKSSTSTFNKKLIKI